MTQPNEPAPGAPAPTNSDPAPGAPGGSAAPAAPEPNDPVDVASLPPNVQHLIGQLRQEAGSSRTKAKATAAEQARGEIMQQISEALGLTEPAADPQELTDQLASTQLAEAAARAELDVYRTAVRLGADADRLLDSRQFVEQINDLPDEKFGEHLEALVQRRLKADPSLRQGAGGGSPADGQRPQERLTPVPLEGDAKGAGDRTDMNAWMRSRAGYA